MWESSDKVVVSDIDGTITKYVQSENIPMSCCLTYRRSDALGHVFTMIGRDWTHIGVAKLYTDIVRNGYRIMYLTSRAIGQADSTRDYLKGINQNNYQLPEGPVIMSPDRLMASLHRYVESIRQKVMMLMDTPPERLSCANPRCSRWLVYVIYRVCSGMDEILSMQDLATG